uniref:BTP domain-containing protein n=1 Tax=Steinernema glaseri TaxID=37863 RepID=A0A1I7ZC80_9BILA
MYLWNRNTLFPAPEEMPAGVERVFSQDPAENFARHRVHSGTAAIIKNGGFLTAQSWSVDTLTHLHECYIKKLFAKTLQNAQGDERVNVTVDDVLNTFQDMYIDIEELHGYVTAVNPFPLPSVPSFPVQLPAEIDDLCLADGVNGCVPDKHEYVENHGLHNKELLKNYENLLNMHPDEDSDDEDSDDNESVASTSSFASMDDLGKAMENLEMRRRRRTSITGAHDFANMTFKSVGMHLPKSVYDMHLPSIRLPKEPSPVPPSQEPPELPTNKLVLFKHPKKPVPFQDVNNNKLVKRTTNEELKRPVGRPRKHPLTRPDIPPAKRPPRQPIEMEPPKRPVGRPRKHATVRPRKRPAEPEHKPLKLKLRKVEDGIYVIV